MAWSIFTDGGGDMAAVIYSASYLTAINAPLSTSNLTFMYDWMKSEGGGGKNNPLNMGPVSGQDSLTSTGQQFGGGASDYVSPQASVTGFQAYMGYSNFTAVRLALQADNASKARAALIASPWASGHYNGGSAFSNAKLPPGLQGNLTPGQLITPIAGFPANGMDPGAAVPGLTPGPTDGNVDCLWRAPSFDVGVATIGGQCIISVSEGHAIVGALLMGAGAIVALSGIYFLMKESPISFSHKPVTRQSRQTSEPDEYEIMAATHPQTKRPPERSFPGYGKPFKTERINGEDF